MDGSSKKQIISILQEANNVLVTVSANPSVDQLAAMIGLTLLLNKADKHGAAVFSGQVPSTLEFLEPEQTVEKNTDSLRDFIIALDKSKADKLRYKVEDDVVKIFITPYRTSLSGEDFEFSQGDFNVDVVVALGVSQKDDLDKAIIAHGRILHDARVITITNASTKSDLGSIDWQDPSASSLCEMITNLAESMQAGLLDAQISTALLTGIVAETERFRNARTSPQVMTLAAQLMAAGANQQLIAAKLEAPVEEATPIPQIAVETEDEAHEDSSEEKDEPGVLRLEHDPSELPTVRPEKPAESEEEKLEPVLDIVEEPAPEKEEPIPVPPVTELPAVEVPAPAEEPAPAPVVDEAPLISVPTAQAPELMTSSPSNDETNSAIHIDEHGNFNPLLDDSENSENHQTINHGIKVIEPLPASDSLPSSMAMEPPKLSGDFNAIVAAAKEQEAASVDILNEGSSIVNAPALDFSLHEQSSPQPATSLPGQTVDSARQTVENIVNSSYDPSRPEPIQALNAQPIDLDKSDPNSNVRQSQENKQSPPPVPPPIIPPMPSNSANPYLNPSAPQGQTNLPPVMPQ